MYKRFLAVLYLASAILVSAVSVCGLAGVRGKFDTVCLVWAIFSGAVAGYGTVAVFSCIENSNKGDQKNDSRNESPFRGGDNKVSKKCCQGGN